MGIFGADLAGDNVHRLALRPAGVLVMGSESHGLTPAVPKPSPSACTSRAALMAGPRA